MKKAIVVGATSGIGKALAQQLVRNGYNVGITGRRLDFLSALKQESSTAYFIESFDVADTIRTSEKLEALVSTLGGLDLLIISAGTGDINNTLNYEVEKKTIETNVVGFTAVADWAFNYFEKQKSGHLVGISSVGGLRGSHVAPAYNASKAYQINYLEGLRKKAKKLKLPIRVTDIRPGLVDTKMAKGEGLFWVMPLEETVGQIYKAIEAKCSVAYVTRRWKLVAALLKWMPRWFYDSM